MTILEEKISRISPIYLAEFDDLIKTHSQFGGGSEDEKYVKGRSFSNVYEFYMYAFYIGLSIGETVDILSGDNTKKFWELENWKPKNLTQHLVACAITVSNFQMNEVEQQDDEYLIDQVRLLKSTIEGYANAGFRYIKKKFEENPDYENDDTFFIRLIGEVAS